MWGLIWYLCHADPHTLILFRAPTAFGPTTRGRTQSYSRDKSVKYERLKTIFI